MRALVSRRLVPPLVCAALVLGPVGTATAAAVDADRQASGRTAPGRLDDADDAIWPDAEWTDAEWDALWSGIESDMSRLDTLLAQLHTLDELDDDRVLTPLLDVMASLAERGGSRLAPAEAARYAKDLEAANTTVQQQLRDFDSTAPSPTHGSLTPTADPVSDVASLLQYAVQDLIGALTELDLGGVPGEVTGLLGPAIGAVTGVLGGVLGALPPLPAE